MDDPMDIFATRPPVRSKEFWDALVALGGKPEQAAPHIPEMTEAAIADEMAQARGRMVPPAASGTAMTGNGGRNAYRSNWLRFIRR